MLKGKNVLLCVTGSIAAYKIAELASRLVKLHCNVDVIMTKNATNFINPITFETLTGNKCIVDTFDRNFQFNVEHVSLAKKADCVMIAPASANITSLLLIFPFLKFKSNIFTISISFINFSISFISSCIATIIPYLFINFLLYNLIL